MSTFTRTAATDLERALRRIGVPNIDDVQAGTIHSFCFRILRDSQVLEATGRVPRPLMDFEQRFLLEDIKGGLFGSVNACDKRIEAFGAAWARLQHDNPGWPEEEVDRSFARSLDAWLRFHEAMLIGEVVPETLAFLRNNPMSDLQPTFDHVIVDEYQDLNRADQVLLDIVARAGSLTVVGDEDQSIYSFRYANYAGMAEFDDYHSGTTSEFLIHCRRCPRVVIEMPNSLIMGNPSRSGRVLVPHDERPDGIVRVVQWRNLTDEASGIADLVQRAITDNRVRPGGVLILAPRRQIGYEIRDHLLARGIDARSFFNEQELQGNSKKRPDCNAQEAYALLTLLAFPDDRVALRCWMGFGSNSLASPQWKRLREYCAANSLSPRQALVALSNGTLRIPHTAAIVARFQKLTERIVRLQGLAGLELLEAVYSENDEWAQPFRDIAEAYLDSDDYSPADLLDAIQRAVSQPELPTEVEYVRVMSLHKSKGLTADLVLVTSLCEGLVPTARDEDSHLTEAEHDEEQRRLFFVAMTRPREALVLSSVTEIPADMAHRWRMQTHGHVGPNSVRTVASRYLAQLGPTAPPPVRGADIDPI